MISQHAGLARRLSLAAIVVLSGFIAVACNPDDPSKPDQVTVKKHAGANYIYCDSLVASPTPSSITVTAGDTFSVSWTVTNFYDEVCNNAYSFERGGTVDSNGFGTTFSLPAYSPGADDDALTATGVFRAGPSAGTGYAVINYASYRDTVVVTVTGGGLAAPTSLSASSVDSADETVSWTNGSVPGGTTTHIEYRVSGSGSWSDTVASSGVSSLTLVALSSSTAYDVRMWHDSSGTRSDTTTATSLFTTASGTPVAPTSLAASSITATSATVTWSNTGATGATTQFEYRVHGSSWPGSPTSIAAGTGSEALTGLTASTAYDVRIWHLQDGLASPVDSAMSLLTTSADDVTITAFSTTCTQTTSGKLFNIFSFSWSITGSASGYSWQIVESSSNDPAGGVTVATGSSGFSLSDGDEWTANNLGPSEYYWIQYSNGSNSTDWFPISGGPIDVTSTTACIQ